MTRHKLHGIQRPRARQNGFSLVELIVAMVIGLTVVGAALAMFVSSGFSGRGSSALSQMTEDASIALSLLRSQIAMAGYGNPTGTINGDSLVTDFTSSPIFGCTGGASDNTVTSLASMSCNNDPDKPDSIIVRYTADTRNTVPTSTNIPTDCVGVGITASPAAAENRYYVTGTSLYCRGNGGLTQTPQPLVENIKDVKITYGVAGTVKGQAVKYVTAQSVGTTPDAAPWNQVTSVRVCIVVRSDSEVLEEATPYTNCAGESSGTPSDKRLYRAFTTTVVLQNRTYK